MAKDGLHFHGNPVQSHTPRNTHTEAKVSADSPSSYHLFCLALSFATPSYPILFHLRSTVPNTLGWFHCPLNDCDPSFEKHNLIWARTRWVLTAEFHLCRHLHCLMSILIWECAAALGKQHDLPGVTTFLQLWPPGVQNHVNAQVPALHSPSSLSHISLTSLHSTLYLFSSNLLSLKWNSPSVLQLFLFLMTWQKVYFLLSSISLILVYDLCFLLMSTIYWMLTTFSNL